MKAFPDWTRGRFLTRWSVAAAALGLWLTAMTALTQRQISVWQNNETLWRPVADAYPDSLFANMSMADALLRRNEFDEAAPYVDKTVALIPNKDLPWVLNLQANLLIGQGRLPQARALLEKSIQSGGGQEAYALLGWISLKLGDHDAAIGHYRQAAALAPRSSAVQAQTGRLLAERGRFSEAIPYYEQAVLIERSNPVYRAELERARAGGGRR